jgi:hypothetical protein
MGMVEFIGPAHAKTHVKNILPSSNKHAQWKTYNKKHIQLNWKHDITLWLQALRTKDDVRRTPDRIGT